MSDPNVTIATYMLCRQARADLLRAMKTENPDNARESIEDALDRCARALDLLPPQDAATEGSPSFVRDLPSGGVESEPLTLTPEAQDEVDQRTEEIAAARDRAAVTGSRYVVRGDAATEGG